jgi:hypothetical protein
MGKLIGGAALVFLGLLMVVGFFNSGLGFTAASIGALLIVGLLPLAAGGSLLYTHFNRGKKVDQSREVLRNQTLIAETLKFAGRQGGRLTIVEVSSEFAITPEQAKDLLNQLHSQDLADIEVTDAGLIVYRFGDVQQLRDKERSKGLLND